MVDGSESFAKANADASKGFNAVPRWFRQSGFWNSLKLEHRGILDEMYHQVRRVPNVWRDHVEVARGQFVTTLEAMAERCGASKQQVRDVFEKAEKQHVLRRETHTW